MTLDVRPVSECVGAEVAGVDLRDLDGLDTAALEDAWAEHGVLFFRDQDLSPEQHIAFAERLAPIDINRFFRSVDDYPQIAQVLKEPDDLVNIGGGWHTDHSYDQIPAKGSILLAREVPPTGGDTQFLSVAAAYEALSDGLQQTLEGLRAHHTNEHVFGADAVGVEETEGRIGNPEGVGGADHTSPRKRTACQGDAEPVRPMIPTIGGIQAGFAARTRSAAEFAAAQHDRRFQQIPIVQIPNQRSKGGVERFEPLLMRLVIVHVAVKPV